MNPDLPARVVELEGLLAHRERQIEAMRRTNDALFVHSSVEAMVRETLKLAIAALDAEAGSLQLYDTESDRLVFRYVLGPAAERLQGFSTPASEGISGRVFRTGVADLHNRVQEVQEWNSKVDEQFGFHTESMLTVPVMRPDVQVIGVVQVLNSVRQFDERDLEVLCVLCGQAATAVENARLLEAAKRAEIVSLIGDISHDIKNMLTPIQTGVWTLRPLLDQMFAALETLREEQAEAGLTGQEIAERLSEAVADVRDDYGWILDIALRAADRVQSRTREIADAIRGELSPPCFEEGDLNETVFDVARSLILVSQSAGVQVFLDLDPSLPPACFDRKQLYNALYNLVNNAIPETPQGGSVTLRTRGVGGQVRLEVQDTGKGMPPDVLQKLFSGQAVSTKPGGTGLGTRIVSGVVERHSGSIEAHSTLGEGSTFIIHLPLRQEA